MSTERAGGVSAPGGASRPPAQRGLSAARTAPAIDGAGAFVPVSTDTYRLEASLTFATVPALYGPGRALIAAAAADLQFDLQRVETIDSAGLALLIDWLAAAKARQRRLRYLQAPPALLALARLSEVDGLISGATQRPSVSGSS